MTKKTQNARRSPSPNASAASAKVPMALRLLLVAVAALIVAIVATAASDDASAGSPASVATGQQIEPTPTPAATPTPAKSEIDVVEATPAPATEEPEATPASTYVLDTSDPDHNLVDFYLLGDTQFRRRTAPDYPERLAALNGKKIRARAYMHPYNSLDNQREFMLMPTPGGCFFCQPSSAKMVVLVRQAGPEDGAFPYIDQPIEVEGTLKLWERGSLEPMHQMFLYVLDDAKVRVVTPEDLRPKKKGRKDAKGAEPTPFPTPIPASAPPTAPAKP